MKKISVIIPAYNEEEVLPQLVERLNTVSETISQYEFEFLFVNDGSSDRTLELLRELNQQDQRMQYVDLSRNYGKETAMLAGFDHVTGDGVVIIDADLQHPPEVMQEMISWWEQGYEDVYAVRKKREGETFLKVLTSKLYYKLVQKMTPEKVFPQAGDFRLLDKKCVVALRQLRESERYTKGMYGWIGFKKKEISYYAEERAAGVTKWKWSKLFKLAMDGVTSYSTVPLKIWSYIGFIISFLAFIFLAVEITKTLLFGTNAAGYPTLLAAILFLGGIQLISLGVIGEYLGRVFVETKGRPPYFTRESSIENEQKTTDEIEVTPTDKSVDEKNEKDESLL
ncbi:glycosyltransferase family 2 protein [Marinilactibacillus piezotolerans]|uniref:glycosyltransferase family 2 protein n=1 Tax=Marinilactibacillus piezotolerans TaxID=258723 RepID=UPI0009B09941|nr:glycosyltransferase family 2 protein [Marinilactibacillus piezotolerans]